MVLVPNSDSHPKKRRYFEAKESDREDSSENFERSEKFSKRTKMTAPRSLNSDSDDSVDHNNDDDPLENAKPSATDRSVVLHKKSDKVSQCADPAIDEDSVSNTAASIQSPLQYSSSQKDSVLPATKQYTSLAKEGLKVVPMKADGNCLFRAIALQIYGDVEMHDSVRRSCMDFMEKDSSHFQPFVTTNESYDAYIARKRQDGCHGNNAEVQACAEVFNRPIHIYTPDSSEALNIFQADSPELPIRLSYHDEHYNAVVDPKTPTAGIGLGLPGMVTAASVDPVHEAVTASDILQDEAELKRAVEESQLKQEEEDWKRALTESLATANDNVRTLRKNTRENRSIYIRLTFTIYLFRTQMGSDKVMAISDLDATNQELEQAVLKQTLIEANGSLATSIPAVASLPTSHVEYPPCVEELVLNGFDRSKVIQAYELIGDDMDQMLAFLLG